MRPARTEGAGRVRGLYAVTPDLADTDALAAKVAAAIEGGARVVQYRSKALPPAARREQARRLGGVCERNGAVFIVNDDAALARDVGADGVHVGEDDGDLAQVRAIVGDRRVVGVSCYDDFERARAAVAAGADYVAFGSFFPSAVKPGARRAPLDLLARARGLGVPIVAIGGITAANATPLRDAGASAVAVISDVFAHESLADVARHARAIAGLFAP
jgi:thiamine-phosphate pyrophosphorylase